AAAVTWWLFSQDEETLGQLENNGLLIGAGLTLIVAGLAMMVLFVLTVVFYLQWQYRVHSNANVFNPGTITFTPGWGVGYWFIPSINFFRPYPVTRQIDEATPAVAATPALGGTNGALSLMCIFSSICNIVSSA